QQVGFCSGIENYSRHIDGRAAGSSPATLIDYFPEDFLTVIDESHVTVPQIGAMYEGDASRKRNLVDFGFRLPSALDNRPLRWEEFSERVGQTVYLSATPGDYELGRAGGEFVEQVIRPTGLVDPKVVVKPTKGQIDDLIGEIRDRSERNERVLVTTLTKKMRSEERRVGRAWRATRSKRDWSSDVCSSDLPLGDTGRLRAGAGRRGVRRAGDPPDRAGGSEGRGQAHQGADRRSHRRDPGPVGTQRARPGHDAHQEDVGGPHGLPARAGRTGAVSALGDRHAPARRAAAGSPAWGIRRPGGDQPPARGAGPPGGVPGRDPRRGQGGLPALEHLAHPDDRSCRPERLRRGPHVRGHDHRFDALRDGGDRAAPREADRVQHGTRDRPATAAEEDRRHPRPGRGRARRSGRRGPEGAPGARRRPYGRGFGTPAGRAGETHRGDDRADGFGCYRPPV